MEVVVVGTESCGLARGKMKPERFLAPFVQHLERHSVRVHIVERPSDLSSATIRSAKIAVLPVVNEEDHQHDFRAIQSWADQVGALMCPSFATAKMMANKRDTNVAFASRGIPVPKLASQSQGLAIFSNEVTGSGQETKLLESGSPIDESRYNTSFIDSTHTFNGEPYYVSLRAMAVGTHCVSIYLRARPVSDNAPSVHSKDTPRDAAVINALYNEIVTPRKKLLNEICDRAGSVLGVGYYAHDIIPSQDGQFFICETGLKYNDTMLANHLKAERFKTHFADICTEDEVKRSADALLQQLGWNAAPGIASKLLRRLSAQWWPRD
ncbi:hypothetical protein LY622_13940 [Halomonas sp. M5N1S17]|uniref:hypothetical protein n=1 Tax=Halomonas alkalisoli TaxID=2907158 RepID=UPI001F427E51|nr:hypothetical protein [Halomonas alkalisoli]MCE9664536.1 hypothetical protein [Halomonas alkalisoli]